jgi:putative ABC transport system substrate-binding protein
MTRRAFITLLGGAATMFSVSRPLAVRAQVGEPVRRIGVRIGVNPEFQGYLEVFRQELQKLGWTVGHNVRIDVRGGTTGADAPKEVAELLALAPDVILSLGGSLPVAAFQQATHTVPIVFAGVVDPVGAGFVANLAHPGGNTTGFTSFEYGISAKWLELLKEIDPRITRVAVLRDSSNPAGIGQMAAMQGAAASLKVEMRPVGVRDVAEIEGGIAAFARGSNGGLVVTVGGPTIFHRDLIHALTIRYRLPAVYPARYFVTGGGLISYGADNVDVAQRVAGYVDRILKGEKPADLPVQAPTKYELVINLKTAKALGLTVPPTLLARADEVIE